MDNLNEDDRYIIVTTLCDKKEIVNSLCENLLNLKLVVGCQVKKVDSIYWWNNELEEAKEYHIEFRTKLSLYKKVEEVIKSIHNYDLPEISYKVIDGGSIEFLEWIDKNVDVL